MHYKCEQNQGHNKIFKTKLTKIDKHQPGAYSEHGPVVWGQIIPIVLTKHNPSCTIHRQARYHCESVPIAMIMFNNITSQTLTFWILHNNRLIGCENTSLLSPK